MVSDVLLRLKPELALTLDADNHACGTYVGYGFTLLALNDKNCIIFNSWARKSALTTKTADDFSRHSVIRRFPYISSACDIVTTSGSSPNIVNV